MPINRGSEYAAGKGVLARFIGRPFYGDDASTEALADEQKRSQTSLRLAGAALLGLWVVICLAGISSAQQSSVRDGIDLYFKAVADYENGKLREALNEIRKAIHVFQRNAFEKGTFMAHIFSARVHGRNGNYARAERDLGKAQEMAKRNLDLPGQALVELRMGNLAQRQSDFAEAQEHYERSLATVGALEAKELAAIVRIHLARILIIQGEYEPAGKLLNNALEYALGKSDLIEASSALGLLGIIERRKNRYDASRELLDRAMEIASNAKFPPLKNAILIEQALTMAKQGESRKAIKQLRSARTFFTKVKNTWKAARAGTALAEILFAHNEVTQASAAVHEPLQTLRRLKAKYELGYSLLVGGGFKVKAGLLGQAATELNQALEIFAATGDRYHEMHALVALSELESARGRLIAAASNADKASKLAIRLQCRQGQADSAYANGMVKQRDGNHAEAVTLFTNSLKINTDLKNIDSQIRCHIARANSFLAMGFLSLASQEVEKARGLPGSVNKLARRADLFLVQSRIALARGDEATAQQELTKSGAIVKALGRRLKTARLLEARAERGTASRDLSAAYALWDQAENIYKEMESPGGMINARSAKVALTLSRGDVTAARKLLRDRYAFQRFLGKDPDSKLLEAQLDAIQAAVAMAAGNTDAAEKTLVQCVNTARTLQSVASARKMAGLLVRAYLLNAKPSDALALSDEFSLSKGWRGSYLKGLVAASEEGKTKEALQQFQQAALSLSRSEEEEGPWLLSPEQMRDRERVLEDYLDTVLLKHKQKPNQDLAHKAWHTAQRLKMRRTLHQLALVGAYGFPGVAKDLLHKQKQLQYGVINARKRDLHSKSQRPKTDSLFPKQGETTEQAVAKLKRSFQEIAKKHPVYGDFLLGTPPSVSAIQQRLKQGEYYVSYVLTRNNLHSMLLGRDSFVVGPPLQDVASLKKQLGLIRKKVDRSHYYKIDKSFKDLWDQLFGLFGRDLTKARQFTVEPDGFLLTFPFEALVSQEFPTSYQEQQAVPMLLDKTDIQRTTSAFSYSIPPARVSHTPLSGVKVFTQPILPDATSYSDESGSSGALLKCWKSAISSFKSTGVCSQSGQAEAIAHLFGKTGKVFQGDRALADLFLSADLSESQAVHLGTAAFLPLYAVGSDKQPFILFSADKANPAAGFCGVRAMMEAKPRPANLLSLAWIETAKPGSEDNLGLLLETLRFMGFRWILLHLWPTDTQGAHSVTAAMQRFYSLVKKTGNYSAGLKKTREALQGDSDKKNRTAHAGLVLFR